MYSSFKDKIWISYLSDMKLVSKYNKIIRFLLCVIDILSKKAWVVCFKDKKYITITNAFQKVLDGSGYNRSMKSWLQVIA